MLFFIPRLADDYFQANNNVSKAVCNKYKSLSSHFNQGQRSIEMYGDMMYTSEAVRTLRTHSKYSNHTSYQFIFTHKPSFTILKTLPKWMKGAYHGNPNGITTKEHPNDLPLWKEFDIKNENYINFNTNVTIGKHLYQDRMKFWLETVPSILSGNQTPTDHIPSNSALPVPCRLLYSFLVLCCLPFIYN
ncbi:LOW QUALITY PROTEIN: hypothetical protein KUTeg_005406 [Tegillarca granosa]|uniref:Uncharacterized protein n=1 Tax=Tegillarca granosa TaxID=220873 RepID=A0ABQ9FNI9_TEGGR|nr:LOW QUALITY PROTEIN: hypothetical protein KUTeg_005406 [Tegillarca granosa]